jgi:hypothetical protein
MPGIPFPAFCTNPSCGAFFLATSIVGVPEGSRQVVHATRMGVGPCPSCGGRGIVPDGEYSLLESRIRDPLAASRVSDLIQVLRRHVQSPTTVTDLMNDLSDAGVSPTKWTPKNLDEALKFVTALMLVLNFLYAIYKDQKPSSPTPGLSSDAREVIELLLDSSRHATPPPVPQPTASPQQPDPVPPASPPKQ